eukprot:COSAG01_NODE_390_length_17672_cov_8.513287_2_plen_611_part_00
MRPDVRMDEADHELVAQLRALRLVDSAQFVEACRGLLLPPGDNAYDGIVTCLRKVVQMHGAAAASTDSTVAAMQRSCNIMYGLVLVRAGGNDRLAKEKLRDGLTKSTAAGDKRAEAEAYISLGMLFSQTGEERRVARCSREVMQIDASLAAAGQSGVFCSRQGTATPPRHMTGVSQVPQPTTLAVDELKELFELYCDGRSSLHRRQLKKFIADTGTQLPRELDSMVDGAFEVFAQEGDEALDFDQFCSLVQFLRGEVPNGSIDPVAAEFARIDSDSNGTIDVAEFLQYMERTAHASELETKTLLQSIDTDHDGKLTIEEFRRAWTTLLERRHVSQEPPPPPPPPPQPPPLHPPPPQTASVTTKLPPPKLVQPRLRKPSSSSSQSPSKGLTAAVTGGALPAPLDQEKAFGSLDLLMLFLEHLDRAGATTTATGVFREVGAADIITAAEAQLESIARTTGPRGAFDAAEVEEILSDLWSRQSDAVGLATLFQRWLRARILLRELFPKHLWPEIQSIAEQGTAGSDASRRVNDLVRHQLDPDAQQLLTPLLIFLKRVCEVQGATPSTPASLGRILAPTVLPHATRSWDQVNSSAEFLAVLIEHFDPIPTGGGN